MSPMAQLREWPLRPKNFFMLGSLGLGGIAGASDEYPMFTMDFRRPES